MTPNSEFSKLLLVVGLVVAAGGTVLARGAARPNPGADQSIGADQRGNIGSPVRDPATTPGPNAQPDIQRDPVRMPPDVVDDSVKRNEPLDGSRTPGSEHTYPDRNDVLGASGAGVTSGASGNSGDRGASQAAPGSEEWRHERD